MNRAFAKSIVGTTLLLLMLAALQTTAYAQSENSRDNRIVGVWDVQVTVRNCTNYAPLLNFRALHKYELGGTGQIVPATNPAVLSPHVSVWKAVDKDVYQVTFKMFRFDGTGNNIGWLVGKNDVAITEDGTGYAGLGRVETFDSNGNSLGTSCPTFTGTRLE